MNKIQFNKKFLVTAGIAVFVLAGIAFSEPPKDKFKNLKVLPKNISEKMMDEVMDEFCKALNIGCDFCHAQSKTDTANLDFASDERPEKEITRQMIRMTNKVNKEFFNGRTKYGEEENIMAVRCIICHRGEPHPSPEEVKVVEEKKQDGQ